MGGIMPNFEDYKQDPKQKTKTSLKNFPLLSCDKARTIMFLKHLPPRSCVPSPTWLHWSSWAAQEGRSSCSRITWRTWQGFLMQGQGWGSRQSGIVQLKQNPTKAYCWNMELCGMTLVNSLIQCHCQLCSNWVGAWSVSYALDLIFYQVITKIV